MSKTEAAIQLHCAGKTSLEIIKLLNVAKSIVYHIMKRFKQLSTSEDRPRSRRPGSARSEVICKTNVYIH